MVGKEEPDTDGDSAVVIIFPATRLIPIVKNKRVAISFAPLRRGQRMELRCHHGSRTMVYTTRAATPDRTVPSTPSMDEK